MKLNIFLLLFLFLYTDTSYSQNKNNKSEKYFAENKQYIQELEIISKTNESIVFSFKVTRKNDKKELTISGKAKSLNSDLGSEIDEDEDGNAYQCTEYWFKLNNCEFSIRISEEQPVLVQTKSADCNSLSKEKLPLDSVSILRKK